MNTFTMRIVALVFLSIATSTQALATSTGIDVGISGLISGGASTVNQDNLASLQSGGHDPNRNGFSIQNVELTLSGSVDPFFDAQTNLIFLINEEGETVVELEEAFLLSTALPLGLQIKAGQFFTEFGRQNVQHPHSWQFVDQPVILSRLFGGDGLRSQGGRISWLSNLPWYSEFQFSIQNASGETAKSFLSAPGEEIGGFTLLEYEARSIYDFMSHTSWKNGFDLNNTTSANLGLSYLNGPNSSGENTRTKIRGADLFVKWQAVRSQKGFPFIAVHTEYLHREYQALDKQNPLHATLDDYGMFSSLSIGYKPGWIAGFRYGYANSNTADTTDTERSKRTRFSSNLTWHPSEFSKIRLQHNLDQTPYIEKTAHSIWVQFEFNLGKHMAHTF